MGIGDFSGNYDVSLDEAGRIAIPRDLRFFIGGSQVVLTKGPDLCIWMYTADVWKKRVQRILKKARPDTRKGRIMRRRYLSNAFPALDLDKQGRVLIHPNLREELGLAKDCKVVGQGNYIEIWDLERWKASECTQEEFEGISELFADIDEDEFEDFEEIKDAAHSAHSGAAGRDDRVSGAEGKG